MKPDSSITYSPSLSVGPQVRGRRAHVLSLSSDLILPVACVLLVWEVLSRGQVLNTALLPPPSNLATAGWAMIESGVLLQNAAGSIGRVLAGLAIASVLGVGGGLMVGTFSLLGRSVESLLELIRPIPPIAWIPLAILWFGLGNGSAVFIVTMGAFFPIFVNTLTGIRSVKQAHVDAARSLGANTRLLVTGILVPSALPHMMTGMRIGVGMAWMSVIAAEMIGSREGLGYAIQLNRTMLETEAVMVNMIVIGIVGWVMNGVVVRLDRRFTRWNTGLHGG